MAENLNYVGSTFTANSKATENACDRNYAICQMCRNLENVTSLMPLGELSENSMLDNFHDSEVNRHAPFDPAICLCCRKYLPNLKQELSLPENAPVLAEIESAKAGTNLPEAKQKMSAEDGDRVIFMCGEIVNENAAGDRGRISVKRELGDDAEALAVKLEEPLDESAMKKEMFNLEVEELDIKPDEQELPIGHEGQVKAKGRKKHKCPHCNGEFANMWRHSRTHKVPAEVECAEFFSCDECSYKTIYKHYFKQHLLLHESDIELLSCAFCDFKTPLKAYLRKHLLRHRPKSEVMMHNCSACPYQGRTSAHLRKHMLVHRKPSEIVFVQCKFCDYKCKRRNSLNIHVRSKHEPAGPLFMCHDCDYSTPVKAYLQRHLIIHTEALVYECRWPDCEFKSKHKRSLQGHVPIHQDFRRYKCELCSYQARRPQDMAAHVNRLHKKSAKDTLKCRLCYYTTSLNQALKRHMLIHKGRAEVKIWKCGECAFETRYSGSLKKHMSRLHTNHLDVKMLKCSFCSYESGFEVDLAGHLERNHIDIETAETLNCNSCSYSTSVKSYLRRHIRLQHRMVKSKLKIHKCTECSFETRSKDYLKRHALLHKDPKEITMHQCGFCSYSSRDVYTFRAHVKAKHPGSL